MMAADERARLFIDGKDFESEAEVTYPLGVEADVAHGSLFAFRAWMLEGPAVHSQ